MTYLLPTRHQYFKTTLISKLHTLMIEGGNYHDSLEEFFILQKIVESKVIRNKCSLSICAIVNVAMSYASVNELKKVTNNFSNYSKTSFHFQ